MCKYYSLNYTKLKKKQLYYAHEIDLGVWHAKLKCSQLSSNVAVAVSFNKLFKGQRGRTQPLWEKHNKYEAQSK